MDRTFFIGIINNITWMLALCFCYRLIARYWKTDTLKGKVVAGFLFGGVAVFGMLVPTSYSSGLIFDGRTIILAVSGVFGGPLPAAIAAAMTGLLRIWQGGVGMWMGLGTIISSALAGVLYHYAQKRRPGLKRPLQFYLFSVAVHIMMLLCTGLLSGDIRRQVLASIALPVILIYPPAMTLYGLLMAELEERAQADAALQESEAKLKAMFDHSDLFIGLLTPDGRLQQANRQALDFIGCEADPVSGQFFWDTPWWPGDKEKEAVKAAVEEAAAGRFTRQEIVCMSRSKEQHIHDLSIKPVFNEQGRIIFLIAEGWDITERKRMEEALQQKTAEIQNIAFFDPLTGLPNRVHLNRKLHEEMERARRGESSGAVMFFDLDDLKMVNDTFGHSHGDGVIAAAGRRIRAQAGEEAFVARISGDEFIVILVGVSERKKVACIADSILGAVSKEHDVCGVRLHMSASAGVTIYPADGCSAEDILKNADNSLYAAKRAGKNCWRFYEESMQTESCEQMLLTNGLRHAVERGEFFLHYQPQLELKTRAIVGFEALLRWKSPEHGLIPPVRFIPLAEQSGLIGPIGQWVIRESCRYARRLANMGLNSIHIAVNVSPIQLIANDFVDNVRGILEEAGIEPQQLELEITESAMLVSLEDIICKLGELHALGVRLALDDFGAGYSSLTYLQRLPVDTLKIDKAFIDMIQMDDNKPAIIGSIVDMAHILKMKVVAEGVELEEQLEYLAKNQCDCIQGYLFSRPLPEEEAVQLLSRRLAAATKPLSN